MKFINYLETISGVGIFPLISLLVFFIFFVVLTVWAFTIKKERMVQMKNIPFDNSTETNNR